MLLNVFLWCISNIIKKVIIVNMSPTPAIIFIKGRNRHHMKYNIRYRCYFAWENLQWGFCDVDCHFCVFIFMLFFICCSSFIAFYGMLHFIHCFSTSSLTLLSQFYREWYDFEGAFFYPQAFFTLRSFTDILPGFLKASLGAGSSSLKFAGPHTDPRNTDPVRLFIWSTVIRNLHIQKNSFINSTMY